MNGTYPLGSPYQEEDPGNDGVTISTQQRLGKPFRKIWRKRPGRGGSPWSVTPSQKSGGRWMDGWMDFFLFFPTAGAVASTFPGKLSLYCLCQLWWWEERRKSFLIFIKNDSAAFLFSLSAFPKAMRFQQSCSDRSWAEWRHYVYDGCSLNQCITDRCETIVYHKLICGRVIRQIDNKGKNWGIKRSCRLFSAISEVRIVAENTAKFAIVVCFKPTNPEGDFNHSNGSMTKIKKKQNFGSKNSTKLVLTMHLCAFKGSGRSCLMWN